MKIAPAIIDNFINKIAAEKIAGCLVYGPDAALAKYRFDIIAKKITPDLSDPFLVTNISKERLSEDSALLSDEFYSLSFLGGRKLILIKDADAATAAAIKNLFQDRDFAKKSDNFILILGGDLDKSSALRKAVEDNSSFAAIACYVDDERVIKKFIENELSKNGIKSDAEILTCLFEKCGSNRQIALSELEKIITYLGEKKELTVEAINQITSSEGEISTNEFIASFSTKKFDLSLMQAEKLFKEGVDAIMLIRFLSNYFQKLYQAKLDIFLGSDFESAVKAQKLFFKAEADFRKSLKLLSLAFLVEILKDLEELEIKIKSSSISSKLLFIGFVQGLLKTL